MTHSLKTGKPARYSITTLGEANRFLEPHHAARNRFRIGRQKEELHGWSRAKPDPLSS
jgi:hypothetical protein